MLHRKLMGLFNLIFLGISLALKYQYRISLLVESTLFRNRRLSSFQALLNVEVVIDANVWVQCNPLEVRQIVEELRV